MRLTDTLSGLFGQAQRGQLLHFSAEVDPVLGARVTAVPGLEGIISFCATEQARFAIDAKGRVLSWGLNAEGQLGRGAELFSRSSSPIPNLADVTQLAAGLTHVLALGRDGTLRSWGANAAGQLAHGDLHSRARPAAVAPFDRRIRQIAAGHSHSLALDDDGRIHAWGSNHLGQLGPLSDAARCPTWSARPVVINTGFRAVQIDAGMHYSVALSEHGDVFTWGWNGLCQLGFEGAECSDKPLRVAGLPGVERVSAGYNHVMAARGNAVFSWGCNHHAACGAPPAQHVVAVPQALYFA